VVDDPFHVELQRLRAEAGAPTYDAMIARCARQSPPVTLTKQTLSDWFTGKVKAPRDRLAQDRLIVLLEAVAQQRGDYRPRGLEWWHRLRAEPGDGGADPRATGRQIAALAEVDAFTYEVHRAIDGGPVSRSVLPPYLTRPHDARLRSELAAAATESRSRLIMLVGSSSTGKTRACWEAMRSVLPEWTVWHPLVPQRPDALLNALDSGTIPPKTVVWLNEAQMYLKPADVGTRVATALQYLLDAQAGPVVVLGSMWQKYWAELTNSESEAHTAIRVLLHRGLDIAVPDRFSDEDLAAARQRIAADSRLEAAARPDGAVTQYLAGVPELVRRYRQAGPYSTAIVHAAMDAHRLGRWHYLPRDFLRRAAAGYLTDRERGQVDGDGEWFDSFFERLQEPCHGADGVLAPRERGSGDASDKVYVLADYLGQLGERERARLFPPETFWTAAAQSCLDPDVIEQLAEAARERGRNYDSAVLKTVAGLRGTPIALTRLATFREFRGDRAGAVDLYREAAHRGEPTAVRSLVRIMEYAGDRADAEELARQAADRGHTEAQRDLIRLRDEAGEGAMAEQLARWLAIRGNPSGLVSLASLRAAGGDLDAADRLYREAAEYSEPSATRGLAELSIAAGNILAAGRYYREAVARGQLEVLLDLARLQERAGDLNGAEELAHQAAGHGQFHAFGSLARLRWKRGDLAGAERFAFQAASRGDVNALTDLAMRLEQVGERTKAEELARRAADLGDWQALPGLAWMRDEAGDRSSWERLFREAVSRGDFEALLCLTDDREAAGDLAGAERLFREFAENGNVGAMYELGRLREDAGDLAGAVQLYRDAADQDHDDALRRLLLLREHAGDLVGASQLAMESANRGHSNALMDVGVLWEKAGNPVGVQLLRYGLANDGSVASPWSLASAYEEAVRLTDTGLAADQNGQPES
jgi:TPR repeat protein